MSTTAPTVLSPSSEARAVVPLPMPSASPTEHRVTFHQNVPTPGEGGGSGGGGGGGTVEVAPFKPSASMSKIGAVDSVLSVNSANRPPLQPIVGKSQPITAYNGPKDALLAVVKAGLAKSILPMWQTCLLAVNAGLFLSMGNLAATAIAGGLSAPYNGYDGTGALVASFPANPIVARFVHGAIFPLGLVLIVLAGSELFTGNVMYLSSAWMAGKIPGRAVFRNLTLAWFGNFAGSLFCAYFLTYLTELLNHTPQSSYLEGLAIKKMSTGWGNVFLKGVGCNWMVCLALWCNLTCQDVISKIFAMWLPIATFVWIGWEHSIANMFLLPIALMQGVAGKDVGDLLAWNLIPVTLGNILGGFLFAMGQWAAYGEYAVPKIQVLTTKHAEAKKTQ